MPSPELKPCKCGGEAFFAVQRISSFGTITAWSIHCRNVKCPHYLYGKWWPTREAAINDWNRRAENRKEKGMTDEPSPRPWRVADIAHDYDILDADGKVAARAAHGNRELAAFIVAAVNKHGMPIVEIIKGYDALEVERDRLRNALNEVCRRVSVALGCPRHETEEVELLVHDLLGIKECARAALGEDKG